LIPIISLTIAALAVIVGPLITLKISRKQFELSRRIADKQIIAPMRQAWINDLRGKVAELTGDAPHFYNVAWADSSGKERTENWKRHNRLEKEIELLINPKEHDHQQLVSAIKELRVALEKGEPDDVLEARDKIVDVGQKIFKKEWDRTKAEIEKP
jgi:hypothetical protein